MKRYRFGLPAQKEGKKKYMQIITGFKQWQGNFPNSTTVLYLYSESSYFITDKATEIIKQGTTLKVAYTFTGSWQHPNEPQILYFNISVFDPVGTTLSSLN
ncbi:hypothetical protein RCL_jg3515.t1 [Rhizophagus clarus]|uniref:Uncharacterized protein n=1 Tax=Rhizophagus clarus TaxID=94130 RepID=A0A8H3M758_9GLOM|nr:hypothetical protein RCL_jg3515.t1 [Rhizophagus clarus]